MVPFSTLLGPEDRLAAARRKQWADKFQEKRSLTKGCGSMSATPSPAHSNVPKFAPGAGDQGPSSDAGPGQVSAVIESALSRFPPGAGEQWGSPSATQGPHPSPILPHLL
ncbi:hypothetical protein B0H17DRAFT_1061816 [Mycena rosella]|uniref:Uncharacterized protein n=1 Tax=Mycena rosella TaxID=1033263 RepID=A0AAD7GKE3_MYCRO|nr:hypothetical protein B0H17DRAFT_1061816 [Mycena rosella]